MIRRETFELHGRTYVRMWSDAYYLTDGEALYDSVVEPLDAGRTYTESATPLPEPTAEELLYIIEGGE